MISIHSYYYEFEGDIKAQWHKVQIKTYLCDVTLSCEDKQMKIHRLIISSYSPIDDLSLKVVTKTLITTKENIEFYQVYNYNIKKNMESTVALQDNIEGHLYFVADKEKKCQIYSTTYAKMSIRFLD